MFERILMQMREKVRNRQYVMSIHAEEEMDDDNLTIYDVERIILTGEITERQKEKATNEWKYLINGKTVENNGAILVGKLSPTGKLIVITVYLE